MEPRVKLWLEQGGRLALSDYRARLLRIVHETGSLARAASAMGLSYRRAWGKVRELEENVGYALLVSDVGGVGGGKSRLTPEAERLLQQYESFAAEVRAATARLYAAHFAADASESRQTGQQVDAIADNAVDAPGNEL